MKLYPLIVPEIKNLNKILDKEMVGMLDSKSIPISSYRAFHNGFGQHVLKHVYFSFYAEVEDYILVDLLSDSKLQVTQEAQISRNELALIITGNLDEWWDSIERFCKPGDRFIRILFNAINSFLETLNLKFFQSKEDLGDGTYIVRGSCLAYDGLSLPGV